MFNLFPFATTAIFNDAPQPWQLGFQDGVSPGLIYCISLVFIVFIPVLISCNDTYRQKYSKGLNIVAELLICLSIICLFYLVWNYLGGGPIECAPELDHELVLRKDSNRSMSENTKAAIAAYTGMVGSVGAFLIKAKAGSPTLKTGIFFGTTVIGGLGINGMLETGNKAHMANVSAPAFASKALTPSTLPSDVAQKGKELLGERSYNVPSPLEMNSDSTGSLFWDYLPKFLPEWMVLDIASRLPSSPNNGTYHILFMQYNLFVYILCIMFILTLLCIGLISILTWTKNNREYLIEKVLPTFIAKCLPSKPLLQAIILINKVSLILYAVAYGYGLYFLYINPIPGDLGMVCDNLLIILILVSPFLFLTLC